MKQVVLFTLYFIALLSLLVNGWAVWDVLHHPAIGISWTLQTGKVESVSPTIASDTGIVQGDIIREIDGVPVEVARYLSGKTADEPVYLLIEHEGHLRTVILPLSKPSLSLLVTRLVPLLLALFFWTMGVTVLAFGSFEQQGLLFFLFCQVFSLSMGFGAISSIGPHWVVKAFGLTLWWAGPLTIHFHLFFPQKVFRHYKILSRMVYLLYFAAGILSLLTEAGFLSSANLASVQLRLIWLIGSLLVVILLLVRAARQQQVRLVAVSAGFALLSFVNFSLLPDTLLHHPILPYEISFLFISLIPLSYGYAILQFHLIKLNRYINRTAAYMFVGLLFASLYALVYTTLIYIFSSVIWKKPLANMAIVLLFTLSAPFIYRHLRVIAEHIFYGGPYNYRALIKKVHLALDEGIDTATLAQAISHEIQNTMKIDVVCLVISNFLERPDTSLICIAQADQHTPITLQQGSTPTLTPFLRTMKQTTVAPVVRDSLATKALTDLEKAAILDFRTKLWLPIWGRHGTVNALIVGSKLGEEEFGGGEIEILETITRQIGIRLQNFQLTDELRRRIAEGVQLHQQALHAREEERKRVARDLHDQIIQSLIAVNYHLSQMRDKSSPELYDHFEIVQQEMRMAVNDLRNICSDLRPPALDNLGLVSALRSYIHKIERQIDFTINFSSQGEQEDLPENVSICVFRAFQEALSNIQKHACAKHVNVLLVVSASSVVLSVEDDGCGFVVPSSLGWLIDDGHFGLTGLRERLDALNGTLELASYPDQGTRLNIQIPLNNYSKGMLTHGLHQSCYSR